MFYLLLVHRNSNVDTHLHNRALLTPSIGVTVSVASGPGCAGSDVRPKACRARRRGRAGVEGRMSFSWIPNMAPEVLLTWK